MDVVKSIKKTLNKAFDIAIAAFEVGARFAWPVNGCRAGLSLLSLLSI